MAGAASVRAAIALAALAAGSCVVSRALAGNVTFTAPPMQEIHVAASDYQSQPVNLGISKSVVIDLPRDIKDVLVADPKIANAVMRSSRRAFIIGNNVGQTNVFFFDAEGKQIAGFDIAVTRDLNGVRDAIRQVLPEADITVRGIGDSVILSGTVSSPQEAQQVNDIVSGLIDKSGKVINGIVVRGRDEVMLKVTVAEVDRSVVKQLGINLSGSFGYGTALVNFNNNAANPNVASGYTPPLFPINGTPSNTITGSVNHVTATLQAMEQAGVIRALAEPTLTAISGESAHFLAGGEFPYPSITSCTTTPCPPTISFQNFGVSLTFTPVVLSEGRISLTMLTEVSQLDNQNTVTVAGTTVPGLSVRRADTTVEIPSGGSLAVAGLIQDETKQDITGLPGLMQVPILGTLFRSRDYLNNRTELMVLVTPYIVRAVAEKDLARPDDGFADPSDPESVLLGRLNRIYGVGDPAPPDSYHGKYGFILD
ncbi:MAG TPA: type II and III secretion system protein family protein [Xanthobacteraceae bacterium]|nr:type II and III secretion system protein family protein [Xanthobacteraceae bacterium]